MQTRLSGDRGPFLFPGVQGSRVFVGRVRRSRHPTILQNAEKQKARFKSRLFKFGSSDWTRTSDIRINSPPFYRLNYRGIGVEAHINGEKSFVKPDLREKRLIADSVVSLL